MVSDILLIRALNMVLPTEIPAEIVKHIKAFAKLNTVMHQVCVCVWCVCVRARALDRRHSLRQMVAGVTLTLVSLLAYSFYQHSSLMSEYLSEPQLMMRGRGRNGGTIIIDDFREAYWWVRDNTPKDSRIMCVCSVRRRACSVVSLRLHVVVGLRLPAQRHCRAHQHCRRQHLEPRAHRSAGQVPDFQRDCVVGDHATPGRLRPDLDHEIRRLGLGCCCCLVRDVAACVCRVIRLQA